MAYTNSLTLLTLEQCTVLIINLVKKWQPCKVCYACTCRLYTCMRIIQYYGHAVIISLSIIQCTAYMTCIQLWKVDNQIQWNLRLVDFGSMALSTIKMVTISTNTALTSQEIWWLFCLSLYLVVGHLGHHARVAKRYNCVIIIQTYSSTVYLKVVPTSWRFRRFI